MLMPNLGRFVRLCVRLTILNLLKVYMNLYLRFLHFNFLKFLNRLCNYGSNGSWSGATPISDGIFKVIMPEVSLEEFNGNADDWGQERLEQEMADYHQQVI